MARILSLCTYPVAVPRHGGQVRVDAIHRVYRAAGHTVRHLAVYRADEYPEEPESPWNVHFSWPFINELLANGGRTDVNAPDFPLKDAAAGQTVSDLITGFEPEIIQLEHCWMWPLIQTLRVKHRSLQNARIVYSSHNVEHELIGKAVRRGLTPVSEEIVGLVRQMEMDLVAAADLVVVVSDADAAVFRAKCRQIVIAANGIWPKRPATGTEFWDKELRGRRFGLFVGSAHPPNAEGFLRMLGPSLSFLSPSELLVIVGGVCNLLRTDRLFRANIGLNMARCALVGTQDEGGLSTFIDRATVMLAPITEGGGTNIKVAEALYNRKLVICTPKAVRGYEAFLDLPFLVVRETPDEYKAALVAALRGELDTRPAIDWSHAKRLEVLLWSSTLGELRRQISDLFARSPHTRQLPDRMMHR